MKNILVFATSVDSVLAVHALSHDLNTAAGVNTWNFDLDDCDRILRVTSPVDADRIVYVLQTHGFDCAELSDAVPQDYWQQIQMS